MHEPGQDSLAKATAACARGARPQHPAHVDRGRAGHTTVFFKGCILACAWCHNPESIEPNPEVIRQEWTCVACGACVAACPLGIAAIEGTEERDACQACGSCVDPAIVHVTGEDRRS